MAAFSNRPCTKVASQSTPYRCSSCAPADFFPYTQRNKEVTWAWSLRAWSIYFFQYDKNAGKFAIPLSVSLNVSLLWNALHLREVMTMFLSLCLVQMPCQGLNGMLDHQCQGSGSIDHTLRPVPRSKTILSKTQLLDC